ncbi:MAG: ORF6N domain-containing protein [Blautia faecis]
MINTNQLVHIGNSDISIKEYNGQRVVTFKDIDAVHGRPDGTASRNFRTNRERFIESEDFFRVAPTKFVVPKFLTFQTRQLLIMRLLQNRVI